MQEITEEQKKEICKEYRERKDNEVPREVVEEIAEKYGIRKGAVVEVLGKNDEDIGAICYGKKVGRPKKETSGEEVKDMNKVTIKKPVARQKKKFEAPKIEENNLSAMKTDTPITVDMQDDKKVMPYIPEKIREFAKEQIQEIRNNMEKLEELDRKIEELNFGSDYGLTENTRKIRALNMKDLEWYLIFVGEIPENCEWYMELKRKMEKENEK